VQIVRRVGLSAAVGVWLVVSLGPLVPVAQAARHSKIEPGQLAFTGINIWLLVLIGAALLTTGVVLRRWTARSARS